MSSLSGTYLALILSFLSWNIVVSHQTTQFKQITATTDLLAEVTVFNARSQIECGSRCFNVMNGNACTAFALDETDGSCTCGKKRYVPVQNTGSVTMIHVIDSCPKMKTGQIFYFYVCVFDTCMHIIVILYD